MPFEIGDPFKVLRSPKYRAHVRGLHCLCSGTMSKPGDPIEAAHIGTLGKAIKSPDDEVIPLHKSVHSLAHRDGEMTVLKGLLLPSVCQAVVQCAFQMSVSREMAVAMVGTWTAEELRHALRIYAKREYQLWRKGSRAFAAATPSYLAMM